MPRQMTVVTPENIPITLELAGLGTRFGALLIDLLVQSIVIVTLLIVGAVLAAAMDWALEGMESIVWAAVILGVSVILFGYFIFFEAIWNGQTPGKRMFGLRVMRDGGYPVNVASVATRNLVRIADFLPIGYAVGALTVFFQPQYKRLGDLVAGTVVVKEQEARRLAVAESDAASQVGIDAATRLPETINHPADVLTEEEIALLRRFNRRRWEMTSDDSERFAYRLVAPMIGRLNLTFVPGVAPRYADLASVLIAAVDAREAEREAREAGQ